MEKFYQSLQNHQISVTHGFAQKVTLLSSDNPYYNYPRQGVLVCFEQGTNLSQIVSVFHELKEDGSLGAPGVVKNPKFNNITTF